MITTETYIISDTHFGHMNIIGFCDRPRNHEEIMIRNWENIVQDDDTVLHLGDVAWADIDYWCDVLESLPGRKKLIPGNHDHTRTIKKFRKIGIEILEPFVQEFDGLKFLFSHYPDQYIEEEWDINIHGHIHNNPLHGAFSPQVQPDKIYFNASVEVMNYRPVKLQDILTRLGYGY
jgi:calcineurin-like phosphoesterase family protein